MNVSTEGSSSSSAGFLEKALNALNSLVGVIINLDTNWMGNSLGTFTISLYVGLGQLFRSI